MYLPSLLQKATSPMNKPAASFSTQITPLQNCDDSPEESGWTTYLEEFCNKNSQLSYCSSFATSSLVSDATSRYPGNTEAAFPDMSPSTNLIMINRMRKNTKIFQEALKDTASSPIHHKEKRCNSYYHETVDKRVDEIVFVGQPDYEFTSLKKRRLCLVPLSLIASYTD